MEAIVFNVKEKTIHHFFEQFAIDYVARDVKGSIYSDVSAYYLMKDELYFKRSSDIGEGQTIVFELSDIAAGSRSELLNTYTYLSEKYDDVGIKLKLIDFKVTVKDKKLITA